MIRAALLTLLLGADGTQQAVRFVACPIYRDTDAGRKSGCWLADEPVSGIRYDITASPTKPDWNHAVLVEGIVATDLPDLCGGMVVELARVSVLEAPCTRHMLTAEGYTGRRFALPARNVRPLYQDRARPQKPYVEGRFTIPFELGRSFFTYQLADYYLDATINYALDVAPARITVAGSAQTRAESVSGMRIIESPDLARERAEAVKRALVMRGVPGDRIRIVAATPAPFVAAAFDGIATAVPRRVDIAITPD